MSEVPERIWLQVDTDPDSEWHDEIIVTWCEDEIHETDPEYVLATRAAELEAEVIALGRACDKKQDILDAQGALLEKRKKHIWKLGAENERLRKDRADALNVKSSDGLLSSEWLWRTGRAERKQRETEAENERLMDVLGKLYQAWHGYEMLAALDIELQNEVEALLFKEGERR